MLKKINIQLLFFQNPFHKFIKKEKDHARRKSKI